MIACSSRQAAGCSNSTGNQRLNTKNFDAFYDTQVEIFMALTELNRSYYIDRRGGLASRSIEPQQIVLYWKPPGALQWVEKCRTETVLGKMNLLFTNKAYIKFDVRDMKSIHLRFVVADWSSVETTMDKLVLAGPRGYQIPLSLQLQTPSFPSYSPFPSYVEHSINNTMPGSLFLRAEILQPAYLGFFLQFRILCDSKDDYYVELYKINQGNLLDIYNAYTLIYRSDTRNTDNYYTPVYFQEPRISNGDDERILKLEVYKKKSFAKKGFALTTLSALFKAPELFDGHQTLILPVDQAQIKTKKFIKIVLKMGKQLPLQPIEYYQQVGLKMLRVYAVDYSRSNWDTLLHKRGLHDTEAGWTAYEEALELIGNIAMEFSGGDSVFYSFGDTKTPFVATFPQDNHMKSLIATYQQASLASRMSNISLSDDLDEILSTDDGRTCIPAQCKPICSTPFGKTKTLIAPLLEEISALISTRNASTVLDTNFEYYTVFILTDGQISDVDKAIEVLIELSNLPVSLILIGIGQGDFQPLIELENSWITPIRGKYISRKLVHVVHFRSICDWTSSLMYYKMRSDPIDVFRKEILTALKDHALAYIRAFLPKV